MHKTLDKRFAEVYNNAKSAIRAKKEKVYEKICYNHACSGNVSYYWCGGSRLRR